METKNINAENVNNVSISKSTKAMITCMAQLGDVYGNVYAIVDDVFGVDADDRYKSFIDTYIAFEEQLKHILVDIIEVNSSESDFKEI